MLRCIFLALAIFIAGVFFISPAEARTLRWARGGDALTLDPHSRNEAPTTTLLQHMYETLVARDNSGKLFPRLATSWRILPSDPAVWEFKLRPNVKFHNGDVMTADDVVFSLDRVRQPESDFKGLHAGVVSVSKVDDLTVQVKMKGPSPVWINNLTNTFIMEKKWAESNNAVKPQDYRNKDDNNYAVRHENGTGPYILVSREPEVRTVLKSFPDYWSGKQPEADEIVYTPIKADATRIAALLSGEVDLVQDVPVQDIERLRATPGIKVATGAENRTIYFSVDVASPELRTSNIKGKNPFVDVRVRRAMNLAMDRDAIHRVVMRGQSAPTNVNLPPFSNGWTKELDAYPKPDIAAARQLLAQAGYPEGFSVNLNCPNDRYINDEAICQAYVGMLGRIGLKVTLVSQSKSQLFPLVQNANVDFYLIGWGVPPFDSSYVFQYLVHCRPAAGAGASGEEELFGSDNGSSYCDRELDKKIEALDTEIDLDKRNAMIAEIWKKVQDDQLFMTVHSQVLAYAMKDDVNLDVQPEDKPLMSAVTFGKKIQ